MCRCALPVRRRRFELRQWRVVVHRRDVAVEKKVVGDLRKAAVGERLRERAVLLEDVGSLLRPDARRAGDLVRRVAAQRDEVRAPAPARRRSARALRRCRCARSRSRLSPAAGSSRGRSTSWNASRSEVATSTGPFQARDGGGEEVVGLVPACLRRPRTRSDSTSAGSIPSCSRIDASNSRPDWYAGSALCRYVGVSSESQATSTDSGCSASQRRIRKFAKPTSALKRIDFGSAWYARCASESPSIASSSPSFTATSRARGPLPSAARSSRRDRPTPRPARRSAPASLRGGAARSFP